MKSFLALLVFFAALAVPSRASAAPPLTVHGGGGLDLQLASGSAGMGFTASIAGRWRELLESRLDLSLLFVGSHQYPGNCEEDRSETCFNAARGVLTPSLGVRLRLAGDGQEASAITPSVGMALGGELAIVPPGRSSWALFAPGLAVSLGILELRLRVSIPRGDTTVPTFEGALAVIL